MKLFVWDFHGVLEKGTERATLEISNLVLREFGYRRFFTGEDMVRLWGCKWYQYFADLLSEESMQKHLALQNRCIQLEAENPEIVRKSVNPNDYAYEVLEKIAAVHEQILISNVFSDALVRFLTIVKMDPYFPEGKRFGVAGQTEHQQTKKEALADYLVGKKFDRIITIGDFSGDIELVEVAGGISYLYAHPGRAFCPCSPDYRIRDLREILREL